MAVDHYRISQLADRVGLPATTLRYYERRGLLPAQRTPAGYRTYDDTDVERVRFISTAKSLGLPLDRIRDLLGVWQHGPCRDVRSRLRPMVQQQISHTDGQIAELGAFRDHLAAAITRLDRLPARATPCDPDCAFLESDAKDQPTVQPHHAVASEPETPPIACGLNATEYTDRAARWRAVLADTIREQLPDGGTRIQLPIARGEEIAALVAAESHCCPFFTFRLTFTSTGIELDAHTPADATALLDDLLNADAATPAC